jgi:hypothetical protein
MSEQQEPAWRVGRKLGTTIYYMDDTQPVVWVPNNEILARTIVDLLNEGRARHYIPPVTEEPRPLRKMPLP